MNNKYNYKAVSFGEAMEALYLKNIKVTNQAIIDFGYYSFIKEDNILAYTKYTGEPNIRDICKNAAKLQWYILEDKKITEADLVPGNAFKQEDSAGYTLVYIRHEDDRRHVLNGDCNDIFRTFLIFDYKTNMITWLNTNKYKLIGKIKHEIVPIGQ